LSDQNTSKYGTLYVVATPIGNLDDITLRALHTLRSVPFIAAEDTRRTGKLLKRHQVDGRLISYHEYNEKIRTPELIEKLKKGFSIAVVSDAGTPSLSDPGYRLVREAAVHHISISPIPGVSAAITALSASGLPTDAFVFIGFPPKKKGKRLELLKGLDEAAKTTIFYESPRRIIKFLEELIAAAGDRPGVLAREMTKLHEEFIRGSLTQILDELRSRTAVKGECTLLVASRPKDGQTSLDSITEEIRASLACDGISVSALSKKLAGKYGLGKKKIYQEALRIEAEVSPDKP